MKKDSQIDLQRNEMCMSVCIECTNKENKKNARFPISLTELLTLTVNFGQEKIKALFKEGRSMLG